MITEEYARRLPDGVWPKHYLRLELFEHGNEGLKRFIKWWGTLDGKDQKDLIRDARAEMTARGIKIDEGGWKPDDFS